MTSSVSITTEETTVVITDVNSGTSVSISEESGAEVVIQEVGARGLSGSEIGRYEHDQQVSSSIWVINHNLGRRPASVSVLSPGGIEVDAGVLHNSENQLTITFDQPYVGTAILL